MKAKLLLFLSVEALKSLWAGLLVLWRVKKRQFMGYHLRSVFVNVAKHIIYLGEHFLAFFDFFCSQFYFLGEYKFYTKQQKKKA